MKIKDIDEFNKKLRNIFDLEIEEDESTIVTVADDRYWILPILETSQETEAFLENELGFENFEELWLFKGQAISVDDEYIYKIKKSEIQSLWDDLFHTFIGFKRALEKNINYDLFKHSIDDIHECIKWRDRPCKTESHLKDFINHTNTIFRDTLKCTKNGEYDKELTTELKGELAKNMRFYKHLRNLRNGWSSHSPSTLKNSQKWIKRVNDSFDFLLGRKPSSNLDYLRIQIRLMKTGIEDFKDYQGKNFEKIISQLDDIDDYK